MASSGDRAGTAARDWGVAAVVEVVTGGWMDGWDGGVGADSVDVGADSEENHLNLLVDHSFRVLENFGNVLVNAALRVTL